MSVNDQSEAVPSANASPQFATTHWSVVLAAGDSASPRAHAALERLCGTYWYPLYAWLRRTGLSPHDAQDMLQGFFARLLERRFFKAADPHRGRFRTFLLTSLKNFVADERDRNAAQKRGGGVKHFSLDEAAAEERYRVEPAETATPDSLYERKWALTLLENALARIEEEYADRKPLFGALQPHLLGGDDGEPYADIGRRLDMTEGAVKAAAHRLRQHYRECLRTEVGHTVERWEDIDEEVRQLFAALTRGSC